MRSRGIAGCLALVIATWLGAYTATTRACIIDGVPSLTVNGYWVAINKTVPSGATNLRQWTPFVVPFALHTGRTEVLAEVIDRVPLQPEAYTTPWRWNFGDGMAPSHGVRVRHVFHRPGVYRVTVEAYFPSHKHWYTFDAVQLRVIVS